MLPDPSDPLVDNSLLCSAGMDGIVKIMSDCNSKNKYVSFILDIYLRQDIRPMSHFNLLLFTDKHQASMCNLPPTTLNVPT